MINRERQLAEDFVLNTHCSVFLTGKAGTGKTTLLKDILTKTAKKTVVVAPTGVAAINAGGITIHSMFQLPPSCFIPTHEFYPSDRVTNWSILAKGQRLRSEQRQLLIELELLIIDEISMVRADLLDAIDYTLRRIRKQSDPFGGVQLLVIGDLFQLAPVVKQSDWSVLTNFYSSPFFFDALSWKRCQPIVIELQHVYRQEDETFIRVLNNIRAGEASDNDLDILNQQYNPNQPKEHIIRLTTHNYKADALNTKMLAALKVNPIKLSANVTGQFSESAYPTPETITLKKGAQVMFIRNDPEGQFFNGKIGVVEKMVDNELSIYIPKEERSIMLNRMSWENVKYHVDKKTKEVEKETCGTFEQYPLRLAWAVTVHKSQGLTFDELIVDLEDSFAAGQLYVALSRSRSLEGLHLSSKLSLKNVIIDERISRYYREALIQENIEDVLQVAKDSYAAQLLVSSFSFDKIIAYTESWEAYLLSHEPPSKADAIRFSSSVFKSIDQLQDVAQRFQTQLKLLLESGEEQSSQAIISRTEKAIAYFTEEFFRKCIQPLEEHIAKWKTKSKSRSYVYASQDLCRHFWDRIKQLYSLTYQGQALYTGEEKYKPVKLFNPDRPKRKVGETYAETMKLFDKGLTPAEIAKERGMAVGTIESHMSRFLKEGKIDIDDLLDDERIKKLQSFLNDRIEQGSNEIMQACTFDISYTEIRWMKNWMKRDSSSEIK